MRRVLSVALPVAAALLLVGALALAQPRAHRQTQARAMQQVVVPQGTDVLLAFDQPLSSKTARVGQSVRLHVMSDVMAGNHVLIRAGTPVTALVSRVDKRKAFGVNATIRLAVNPVRSLAGVMIPLQPRTKGAPVSGEKSAQAAGATVGGAAVLGPVGLVGGYFVKGKPVEIKVGDNFDTEVARAIVLRGTQLSRLPLARRGVAMLPTEYGNLQSQQDMQSYSDLTPQQEAALPSDQYNSQSMSGQTIASLPSADQMGLVLPQGTDVLLAFDQPVSSDTAQEGMQVPLHVVSDVVSGGRVIIPAGTPVMATVTRVSEQKPFGVNADLRLALSPIVTASGVTIPLEARTQGQPVGGSKSAQAAGATVGGAAILGPVGLVGGYFVKGQPVNIAAGDQFDTDVASNVVFSSQQLAMLPAMSGTQTAQIVTDQNGQQFQCVPVTCVPAQSAPQPQAVLPGEIQPVQPDLSAQAPQQCPVSVAEATPVAPEPAPVVVAPAPEASASASAAVCPPGVLTTPAPVAAAPAPEKKNYCAGFPDLPTAMDNGYSC